TGFFTPVVDSPAAIALRVISKEGLSALTPAQRLDWARLLVSFGVRTPEALRDTGPNETRAAFALVGQVQKGRPTPNVEFRKSSKRACQCWSGISPSASRWTSAPIPKS